MNKRTIIGGLMVILIALLAYIYFGLIQDKNFFGKVTIPCNDTAIYTYSTKSRLLIKVTESCGTLNIETKSNEEKWEPLKETDVTLGTPKVIDFDSGYVAFVEVKAGGSVRFLCYDGEKGNCKIEVINLLEKGGNKIIYDSPKDFACNTPISTHIYNFIKSRPPIMININWESVCKQAGTNRAKVPEIYLRGTKQRKPFERSKADKGDKTTPFKKKNYFLDGGNELFIKCPGNRNNCKFTVSAIRK